MLLALRDLASARVRCTLLTREAEFVYRPMAVAEPFARGQAAHHRLDAIATELGAELVRGRLVEVDVDAREASPRTAGGWATTLSSSGSAPAPSPPCRAP